MKLCECGCGKELINEKNRFIRGHNAVLGKGKKLSSNHILNLSKSHTGHKHSSDHKFKISEALKERIPWNKGKNTSEETKVKLYNSLKGRIITKKWSEKISKSLIGRKLSKEHRLKISDNYKNKIVGMMGKNHSLESRLKISKSGGNRLGKKNSPETKFNMSISSVEYINNHLLDGKKVTPRIGNNETTIIDQIENALGIKGISNDKTLFLKCGKWPDRYYKEYNICVDILEDHHFKVTGELSDNDQNRELIIAWKLGCIIYYIPEQEFLKNPEKEIQRFKDFLVLLDERNSKLE